VALGARFDAREGWPEPSNRKSYLVPHLTGTDLA
jgi:hypothetical protein